MEWGSKHLHLCGCAQRGIAMEAAEHAHPSAPLRMRSGHNHVCQTVNCVMMVDVSVMGIGMCIVM